MARNSGRLSGILLGGLGFGIAAGIAAGALLIGPNLPGDGGASRAQIEAERDTARLDAQIGAAQAKSADAVVAAFGPAALSGVLSERPVLVLRTADAADTDVAAVLADLIAAGAQTAGEITLSEKFTDQNGADQLKTIIANTLPAGAQLSENDLAPGTHAGEALGSALLLDPTTGQPQATEEERALLLGALKETGYLDYRAGTILPAQAIVLVLGDSDGTAETAFGAQLLADFAQALDTRGNGVVVAGRIHTAADEGVIGRLRADSAPSPEVSTVDSVDRAWGQLATVLAVREQLDGSAGNYGSAASAEASSPALPTTT